MNKLEKYAVKRIVFLATVMDRQRILASDELQQTEPDIHKVQSHNVLLNRAYDEIKEVSNCLLDQPTDDLPF